LQRFLAGALRRDAPIPDDAALATATSEHVAGNDRLAPAEQADIYRRQFWMRHGDSLAEDYPGLRALAGADVFDALVHAYLGAHPPRTPSLRDLGADIVAFAEAWDGFPSSLRAAALELLRYEHAFVDLFDGAEPPPLDPRKLDLPPEAWEHARLVLHPRMARFALEYPVHHYRRAAAAGEELPAAPEPAPVSLVLFRRDLQIRYEEVEPQALALLEALAAGLPLAPACERVAAGLDPEASAAFEGKIGAWFQAWTAAGWIVDVVA
jgi:hypothetical protein